MPSSERMIQVYQELAESEAQHGSGQGRDRLLLLAADAALAAGRADEAERLRARLLQLNPHHMLKPFRSLADALQSPDVQSYMASLRAEHPPAQAEARLAELHKTAPAAAVPAEGPIPFAPADAPKASRAAPVRAEKRAAAAPEPRKEPPKEPPMPRAEIPPPPPNAWRSRARARPVSARWGRGHWLATLLFGIVLLASLGLAGYTLVRPFLVP